MLEFMRISCAVPAVAVADVQKNVADICAYIARADAQGSDLVIFPELAVTGYTCADLFFQETLLRAAHSGLAQIAEFTGSYPRLMVVVGLPVQVAGQMYNCAAVITAGKVIGLVPKTYLPNHHEFYERR